ncbi:MAG: hypothetical protein IAF58_14755 [Leptolyngbya sp.]|nr:hypothetical protein [Candidatus Melainabacteria bacterium]
MQSEIKDSLKGFQRLDLSELECLNQQVKAEKFSARGVFAKVTKAIKELAVSRKLVQEFQ